MNAEAEIAMQLKAALDHHRAGRLAQAEALYRQILQFAPDHSDALHWLGVIAHQAGQNDTALELINRAIGIDPLLPIYHDHCGMVLQALGKYEEAIACYRKAITLKPDYAEAHNNLGNALKDQRKLDDAIASYRQALSRKPDFAEAHNNLGTVLQEQGQSTEAIASYRKALALRPNDAMSHYNLGNALRGMAQLDEAAESYRKALSFRPDYVEAYFNLGIVLQGQGNLRAAVNCYQRAISLRPDYAEARHNLGDAQHELGRSDLALNSYQRALDLKETPEFRTSFVRFIRGAEFIETNPGIRRLLIRAMSEPWARPTDLASVCIRVIAQDRNIGECIERSANAWPTRLARQELLGATGLSVLSGDALLRALLENAPVCDLALERLLTTVRLAMLDDAAGDVVRNDVDDAALVFHCALARQCFINDFVFSSLDGELERVQSLRAKLVTALQSGAHVPALWIVSVAAYGPLSTLTSAEALLRRSWPGCVTALLAQQITEPLEERSLRDHVKRLTSVDDDVSRSVRQQYEENPYPRWIRLPPPGPARGINSHLARLFPLAPFRPIDERAGIDCLIAGCGTGQESIETAQDFPGARVLAVDLSLASLCYATRKASELGIANVEHVQSDLLRLGSIGRTFDVITSVGVLHHLADPMAGWRDLLSLLRPGGFMLLGLYSERARRTIVAARAFIAERGYTATAEDIRRCRQDLMSAKGGAPFRQLASIRDFYSTGECRDLLFHVQEHRYSLPGIGEMIAALGLRFIGFLQAPQVIRRYAERFPEDRAMTDLDHWNTFEAEFPDTFAGMYVFWVQKPALPKHPQVC